MKRIGIISLLFLVTGCNSCLHNIAFVHPDYTYLNIIPDSAKLSDKYLEFYIDSILNKKDIPPDSIKSLFYINSEQKDLFSQDRLVHFKEYPEEWYLIAFDATPCWIMMVYKVHYIQYENRPIANIEDLYKGDPDRIKKRLKTDVFDKAELYAKQNNIPDSVVYIQPCCR